jgi:hypothetical protein
VLVQHADCQWHLNIHLVASLKQLRDDMTTSLSTAAGEHDSLAARCHSCGCVIVNLEEFLQVGQVDDMATNTQSDFMLFKTTIPISNKCDCDLPL